MSIAHLHDTTEMIPRLTCPQGGGVADHLPLKQKEKRVIHEGPRRTTKALRLTRDTSRQDCRFPIVSILICTAGQGPHLSETKEKRVIHEGRRRATKARLTATGCQGCEGMVDFRLFCSCMIRPAGRGPDLSETKPVSLSDDPPRRVGRGPNLSETNACAWWLETGS